MSTSAKRHAINILEAAGVRPLAQRMARGRLRILCYHGFSLADEHLFRPKLFVTAETFRRRLSQLRADGYVVLPLCEALQRSASNSLPDRAAAITIDDGFHGVAAVAAPILREFGFPATLYLTSYYSINRAPIFRLAVQYLSWKSGRTPDLAKLGRGLDAVGERTLRDETVMGGWEAAVIKCGESAEDETERGELLARLAAELNVDMEPILASRILHLVDESEVAALAASGVDIQLHTHTHRFPREDAELTREIERNRDYIRSVTGNEPTHLCYPSGRYDERMFEVLERIGVASATTCHPGLVRTDTPRYRLPRILDGEALDHADFRSEVTGVKTLLRRCKAALAGP